MSAAAALQATFAGRLGSFALAVDFAAPMQGVTALFGPSGSGKTSVLRCMAGLLRLEGRLLLGEACWQDSARGLFRKPHRRPVGYVFQEASLFPHLSVERNLLYGARRSGESQGFALPEIVELLGIAPLLGRAPEALSGGERQRVAIGRALLSQPRLLLMDEPLSALDRETKAELLPYLEALHARLSIPIVYVSHDLAEVERLADTLVLLRAGRVLAAGPLAELEADPALPLARDPEAAVTLQGRVTAVDEGYALTTLAVDGGRLLVPGRHGAAGSRRRLRIKASDVSFALSRAGDSTILNCLPARILSVSRLDGGDAQVTIVAGLGREGAGARILARVTRRSQEALALGPGRDVFAQIKSVALVASAAGRGG